MFGNIGWGEFMVLLVAALVILGPERLPGAVSWVTKSLRQVRDYAGGATQQLKDELGPEFEDLRKPLSDLQQLRGMTPRSVITKHLLDGDDSILTGNFDAKPKSSGGPSAAAALPPSPNRESTPLGTNERPPYDADAT
ncbi:Sec-independent protein translocase protein TatB [Rhodococcus daqingensis]|uniref:Sec-independent protein translocase protein TatB n=1 Tax=Rhodococcus daqingensis TaxID=2479363 RepID=A0ABW2RYM2_9NOCA